MKKVISALFVLIVLTISLALSACGNKVVDENPQGLQFYLQDDGTYIVSCGGAKYLSNIIIPETYKGGAIISIEDKGFAYCTSLKSITIPDSVTSIGTYAFFGCESLKSVTIPEGVTYIGQEVFVGCVSMEKINFKGTIEQWNAIEKHIYWGFSLPVSEIICSNGTVTIE